MKASEQKSDSSVGTLRLAINGLRKRSATLRLQAFGAIALLVAGAASIAFVFLSMGRYGTPVEEAKRGDPYDYRKMEARHEDMALRLKDFSVKMADARQELINEKFTKDRPNIDLVAQLLKTHLDELSELRADIESRLAKDRQDLYLEVLKLRSERDQALDTGIERRSFIRLVGDAVMRAGVLVLSVYVIAIISSIAKYWFRVADHLNSIADSLDLAYAAGLGLEGAIVALTPHAIDYQAEDWGPLKSMKGLAESLVSRKSAAESDN